MRRSDRQRSSGIILLVVLSMLTFFSLLVAAYLVFSSQALQSSFSVSTRNIKAPNPNAMLDEALMTLIRGTNDGRNPFFGEDLLSDFYGRTDRSSLRIRTATLPDVDGFLTISVESDPADATDINLVTDRAWNDIYAGRVITFVNGQLRNRSYRVLRSIATGTLPTSIVHDFIFERDPDLGHANIAVGDRLTMNGVVRNSPGIGFDGTNVNQTTHTTTLPGWRQPRDPYLPFNATSNPAVGFELPLSLQPNHLGRNVLKNISISATTGDFDESYDAPDFNNWFLSYRDSTRRIIPSFHRPAVINYILNAESDWPGISAATPPSIEYQNVVASLARGTMRPIPIAANQFGAGSSAIHPRFTGGNENFALRIPLLINNATRLDQIARVLTGIVTNPWDVDNDDDGVNDSIWVDIGLPVFTSPEGKLLKPLIAPMIEDLSGKLNLNAHGNYALIDLDQGLLVPTASGLAGSPSLTDRLFRGLGYGPAEIDIPLAPANDYSNLLESRYRSGAADNAPGTPGNAVGVDVLSLLTSGWRPATLNANSGYSNSIDPYGRGGAGLSVHGQLTNINTGTALMNNTATTVTEPATNEAFDHPYDFDPSGELGGDSAFTTGEIEPLLRRNSFDRDLLSNRLSQLAEPLIAANAGLANALTTLSKSDDSPIARESSTASAYKAFADLIGPALTNDELAALIAPEIRLGRKLDVNRPFGNGIDDNGNNVIDDPSEFFLPGVDDDWDGVVDEADETSTETRAFGSLLGVTMSGGTVPAPYLAAVPKYDFDEPSSVSARQLLARHLYVLMMTISNDLASQFPTFGDSLTPSVPVSDRLKYRARRIAQWAVNVVDYRDPDSIMTRFVYDEDLSDGWGVAIDNNGDGVPEVFEGNARLATHPLPTRTIVWGVEAPELVFSESLALHDIRVRDTNFDSSGQPKNAGATPPEDNDTDQVRVPQGSLFLELYCPRRNIIAPNTSPLTAGIPQEMYTVNTGASPVTYSLQLDRTVTTRFNNSTNIYGNASDTAHQTPVWRIAISEPHIQPVHAVPTNPSPLRLRERLPDTLSFQPGTPPTIPPTIPPTPFQGTLPWSLDELDISAENLNLERFVFFTTYLAPVALQTAIAPIPDITNPSQVFFNYNSVPALLEAERYLTLAPRTSTALGSRKFPALGAGPIQPSSQRFSIESVAGATGLIQYDLAGTKLTPDTTMAIQPGFGLVAAGFPGAAWTGSPAIAAPEGIGLNVSEPLPTNPATYYREPEWRYTTAVGTYPQRDAYVEFDAGGIPVNGAPLDQPEDMRLSGPIRALTLAFASDPDPFNVADPMLGTVLNYRTAFLQRLADPTRGFHPVLNPYRTVDQISIDLTVFSGEENPIEVTKPGEGSTNTSVAFPPPPLPPLVEPQIFFPEAYAAGTRQRDGLGMNGVGTNVLFSYSTTDPTVTPLAATSTSYFANATGQLATTFNFLNSGFGAPLAGVNRGRPATPFAMHPWLNRPFASPMELMLVPACSQGRLFEEFSTAEGAILDPVIYPNSTDVETSLSYANGFIAPFRHLFNFFNSATPTAAAKAAEFSNLFEFVRTLPRFRGEITAIDPSRLTSPNIAPFFSPPFNLVGRNTRIGRINLNSVGEFSVWQGLMQGHLNNAEFAAAVATPNEDQVSFNSFLATRRGYGMTINGTQVTTLTGSTTSAINYDPDNLDPRFPTEFAGVFKSSLHGRFAPQVRNLASVAGDETDLLRRRAINATVLRGEGTLANQEGFGGSGLPTEVAFLVRSSAEVPTATTFPYLDRNRNPFLRYQTLMRMPNLASDNSQTFLIRMTMGFFELDASNNLAAEYKEASGENQRYKAMFIIDRSIPVGFIPGQDLNARDTVVFERFYQ